jgi:hypothetical protein
MKLGTQVRHCDGTIVTKIQIIIFNPFTAKIANKQLLGRPPKSLLGTKSHKNEHSFIYQNCVGKSGMVFSQLAAKELIEKRLFRFSAGVSLNA